jgi:uncharacterized protein (DUF1778 family)
LSHAVNARVDSDIYELLRKISKARGEDVSSFVRRSILSELARLSYLDSEQEKALGLPTERGDTR